MARHSGATDDSVTVRVGLVVASALIVAAIAGLLTLPHRGTAVAERRSTVAADTLPPRESGGRVLQHFADAGFLGVVLDPQDPALLQVVVPRGSQVVDCNLIQPRVVVRSQDADAVRIVVSGYQYVPRSSSLVGGTTCITSGQAVLAVRLAAPLGSRALYDAGSPSATVVADPADLPQLRPVPAGYRLVESAPVSAGTARFVATRTYRKGTDELVLRVGSKDDVQPPGTVDGNAMVGGDFAQASLAGPTRCLTWTEDSGRVRQLCATTRPVITTPALAGLAATLR